MKLVLLCIATLAVMVSVEACGGKKRPPPVCHFTTCSVRYTGWDDGAHIGSGKCGIQYNRAQIITQRHQRNGGCPANQQCHNNNHSRRMCKCVKTQFIGWSQWYKDTTNNKCQMKRFMKQTMSNVLQTGSCSAPPLPKFEVKNC